VLKGTPHIESFEQKSTIFSSQL